MKLTKDVKTNKTFAYSKGGVNLSFTLNIDDKKQMENFKVCLYEAIKDIDITLLKIK